MAFLVRPIRPDQIEPTVALAIARFRDQRRLQRALEDRKVIERAKGRRKSACQRSASRNDSG